MVFWRCLTRDVRPEVEGVLALARMMTAVGIRQDGSPAFSARGVEVEPWPGTGSQQTVGHRVCVSQQKQEMTAS